LRMPSAELGRIGIGMGGSPQPGNNSEEKSISHGFTCFRFG